MSREANLARVRALMAEMAERDSAKPAGMPRAADPMARLAELKAEFQAHPVKLSDAALKSCGLKPSDDSDYGSAVPQMPSSEAAE